ncbi:Reticulon-domain-containing protein [Daldinia decipiens]|uniref:Reticulon-domain-containing protein n=1 Tax=Daldinia decipiens TaxID=326647 RepID=UPI0020C37834|nr:Reticulon-domain-containing protein [Daldinia decipiens]KAI1660127.1 Reticulon-domain-containing protein [Daldinia decipiens]
MASNDPTANGSSIDSLKGNATAAYNQIASGPVAQNVKDQTAKTSAEFSNLANARQTPSQVAATGQPLTHYHSFFSELLSWNNPRASAIAYASIVSAIFVARYLDVIRYTFKLSYMALAVTILAEVAGKAVLGNGLTTQFRPSKYYTIPRETLDALIGDAHELLNFFVIESQRILFAENVTASVVAAVGAFLSYYLVKIVPYWGLALISTTLLFFVPLVYATNQELIDHYLKQASDMIDSQTEQLREVAGKYTSQATGLTKQYVGDYAAKAQQILHGQTKAASKPTQTNLKESDFPKTPKETFQNKQEESSEEESEDEEEPLVAA